MKSAKLSPKCAYLMDDSLDLSGKIIYVEHEYQSRLNQFIQSHYEEICATWKEKGLEFVYLPKVASELFTNGAIQYQCPKTTSLRFPYPEQQNRILNDVILGLEKVPAALVFVDCWNYCAKHTKKNAKKDGKSCIALPLNNDEESLSLATHIFEELLTKYTKKVRKRATSDSTYCYCKTSLIINSDTPQEENDFYCKADIDFDEESKVLIQEVRTRIAQLQQKGLSAWVLQKLLQPEPILSRLVVQKNFRIILPDYNNLEIRLMPLPRAVFLLFLRHPEGIVFKYLPDYQEELMAIYQSMAQRTNMDVVRKSIEDICNPLSNAINEKCARIREEFVRHFTDDLAKYYYITGRRGEPKGIALMRDLVEIECVISNI